MQIFAPVTATDARSLAGPTLEVTIEAGTEVVHEGHPLGTFFVIRSGTAELWRCGRLIRVLGSGECFGEIDAGAYRPQPYTVVAGPKLRVLTFSTLGIGRMCTAVPHLRQRLLAALPDEE
jgi:CRP-like cAMP-binding protein